ncbi:MAG: DUF1700 domain-containing protein [Lachnospiraceae bacterium]|nr:DUF1700 domain-containing protein [Lachnospiraceae bacterium]
MSRWEFMRQLEELLSDIAPAEREEALQYYNDYFNDAGRENEQEVISALGTPEQVAQIVKDGLFDGENRGAFTEQGFQSSKPLQNELVGYSSDTNTKDAWSEEEKAEQTTEKKGLPTWAIVLLVIAGIIFSPVILGAVISLFGVLFGALCSVFGIVIGIGAATLALYVAAIALLVAGFGCILVSPLAGIGIIGAALICAAVGILFMLLFYLLVGKCIPGICQGIAYIWKKIFGKKEVPAHE